MSLWRRILTSLSRDPEAAGEASCEAKTGSTWKGG